MTVLELECTLGGRRYDHFDHDAANRTASSARSGAVLPVGPIGIGERRDTPNGEYLPTY
ncbi:hypothetical protein [Burkholderia ubonensis]|nr:hypothetical protein [Burkholderia ubonensis]